MSRTAIDQSCKELPSATARPAAVHFQGLDALRGMAALWVVAYHVAALPPILNAPPSINWAIQEGWGGVTLFYCLSAFTLAHTWLRNDNRRFVPKFWQYLKRRFFRIAPLFYVMMAIYLIRAPSGEVSFGKILANAIFLQNFFPGHEDGIVWASWSIGVEMPFYLLMPFMLADKLSWRRLAALGLGVFLLANTFRITWTYFRPDLVDYRYFSLFNALPIFVIGFLAYKVRMSPVAVRAARSWFASPVLLGLGASLLVLTMFVPPDVPETDWIIRGSTFPWVELRGCAFALIILSLTIGSPRWLVNKCTVFLGQISFSLYLWHPLVVYYISKAFGIAAENALGPGAWLLTYLLTVLILVPVAALSYRIIEKPFLRGVAPQFLSHHLRRATRAQLGV